MNWLKMELIPLFELIYSKSSQWKAEQVVTNTVNLGEIIKSQLDKYREGRYRSDRNETIGFFEAIEKFSLTALPITLEHFQSLVNDYKKRILPYPHYSGIVIQVPEDLMNLKNISPLDVPA